MKNLRYFMGLKQSGSNRLGEFCSIHFTWGIRSIEDKFARSILAFSIISILISCQNRSEVQSPPTFKDSLRIASEKIALEDFQNNKLRLFAEKITGKVYDSLLLSDYKIQTYNGHKRDDEMSEFYVNTMDSLLFDKFDDNIRWTTHLKSQKIEYFNRTGISPDDIEVIDISDHMQEIYLSCFFNFDSISITIPEMVNYIRPLMLNEGFKLDEMNIKLEIDTTCYATEVHSNRFIPERIKTIIIQEINRHGKIGYFEMDGKRKNFMIRLIY